MKGCGDHLSAQRIGPPDPMDCSGSNNGRPGVSPCPQLVESSARDGASAMSGSKHYLGPEPDGDARPWEHPGAMRWDCAPHRGPFLILLETVVLLIGLSSLSLVLTGLLSFPLALVVEGMAQRDLERMQAGTMDPNGRGQAETAQRLAQGGVLAGFLGGVLCALPLWGMVQDFLR
jgi:hypothetical protein